MMENYSKAGEIYGFQITVALQAKTDIKLFSLAMLIIKALISFV